MSTRVKNEEIKSWDIATKIIALVALLFLIFSFFAPYIFTKTVLNSKLNFTNTGQIGDTIGGIMNPFIAMVGILITFLAFYIQIKSNQLQLKIFKDGIEAEKAKDLLNEKLDCYYKLSLLEVDLGSILKDIENKSKRIKVFYLSEKHSPFISHILLRSASRDYTRIIEIDRLSIYKGFNFFSQNRDNWLNNFNNLYTILDYLPEFFDEIYNNYDRHSKDIFSQKMNVRNDLIKLMNLASSLMDDYKKQFGIEKAFEYRGFKSANDLINRYYKIVEESYDENGNVIEETDFKKIEQEVLKLFIEEVLSQKRIIHQYDQRLGPLVELTSDIRKQIFLIKERVIEFANNIEEGYNRLNVDQSYEKSIVTTLSEINNQLGIDLKAINIDKL